MAMGFQFTPLRMIKFRVPILYEISNIVNQIVFKLYILCKTLVSYKGPMLVFEIYKMDFFDMLKHPQQ